VSRSDDRLDAEIEHHLEQLAAEYERGGMSPDEARLAARRAFGGVESMKERHRDARGWRWVDDFVRDVRYALRTLRRDRGVAAMAVLTLALGIGTATSIFSVVNTVLLRPLPYNDPDGIYRIRTMDARGLPLGLVGRAHIDPLNDAGPVLAAAYGFMNEASIAGPGGLAVPIGEYLVSTRFFEIFTDPLVMGDGLAVTDGPATVLSHRIWREVFESDPDIVGSIVVVNGGQRRVTGITAPGFEFPSGAGVWTRMTITPGPVSDVVTNMEGYVRLKPGASADQLEAALDVLATRLGPWPDGHALQFVSLPLLLEVVGDFQSTVLLLSAAAAILWMIACLNIASLLLTRGAAREREIALRGALGAGRARVIRQLMTEVAVLCVLGGAVGLALAAAGVRVAGVVGFTGLPRLAGLGIDRYVLLFTAVCTVSAMLAVGLASVLRGTGGALFTLVNGGGRSATSAPARRRLFGALVVAEVALAVTLVIGGALLVRSYARLASVDLGFDPERLVTMTVNVTGRTGDAGSEYLPVARFYQELMGRLRAVPGVEAVAATSHAPLTSDVVSDAPFLLPGETFDSRSIRPTQTIQVSPDYFEVMGIRPAAGRLLSASDRRGAPGVVLVNEAFVRSVYAGGAAVGRKLGFPGATLWARGGMAFHLGVMAADEFEIVGVVPDIRERTLWDQPQPTVYFPQEQWTTRRMAVVVRGRSDDPRALVPLIRAELAEMDPAIPPAFHVYADVMSAAMARQRLGTALVAAFGLASLALALVGIYGLMSYSVSQRTSEIAIRSALGARSGELLGMIVGRTLWPALVGIALGAAGAWAMRTVVASQLYEISAADPVVFAVVPAVTVFVAMAAAYVPARRAVRLDPVVVLRGE
jgi:putative ABC transport system permease protein